MVGRQFNSQIATVKKPIKFLVDLDLIENEKSPKSYEKEKIIYKNYGTISHSRTN
jgi:hypothetical protein